MKSLDLNRMESVQAGGCTEAAAWSMGGIFLATAAFVGTALLTGGTSIVAAGFYLASASYATASAGAACS